MKRFAVLFLALVFNLQALAAEADLAYFKQFLFQKEMIGNDPDFPRYNYYFLATAFKDQLPMPDGRYLMPVSDIFMNEDGTFLVRYREYISASANADSFYPGVCKKFKGQWSVPDAKLILEGVGIAERITVDGRYAVRLTYDRDIGSAGLKGHSVNAGRAQSTDQDPTQFPCM